MLSVRGYEMSTILGIQIGEESCATPLNSKTFILVPRNKWKNTEKWVIRLFNKLSSTKKVMTQTDALSLSVLFSLNLIWALRTMQSGFENFFAFHMFFLLFHFKTMSCQAISKSKFSSSVFTSNSLEILLFSCVIPAPNRKLQIYFTSERVDIELTNVNWIYNLSTLTCNRGVSQLQSTHSG